VTILGRSGRTAAACGPRATFIHFPAKFSGYAARRRLTLSSPFLSPLSWESSTEHDKPVGGNKVRLSNTPTNYHTVRGWEMKWALQDHCAHTALW
jgi:hypothetical protein